MPNVTPNSSMQEVLPAAPFAPNAGNDIPVFAGYSSRGSSTPQAFGGRQYTALATGFGCGPGVKDAAYFASKVNTPFVFCRVNATPVAATLSAVNVTGVTTTGVIPGTGANAGGVTGTIATHITATGTPLDNVQAVVRFTVGGALGTAGILYVLSFDGGNTWSQAEALGTSLTLPDFLTPFGLTVTLGSSAQTVIAGDWFSFTGFPASQSITPVTINRAAAQLSTPNVSLVTGTEAAYITLSGTPSQTFQGAVKITTAGTVGTSFSYEISTNGGTSYGAPVNNNGSLTITDFAATYGVTVNLGTGHTFAVNDVFTFAATNNANLPAIASTSVPTASGSPNDKYSVVITILTGGTVGTTGITYQISIDGQLAPGVGQGTTSSAYQLGTSTTILPLDGVEPSGLTVTLGAGTLNAGDQIVFGTTAPECAVADVITALTTLKASNLSWGWVRAVGAYSCSSASTLSATIQGWATGTTQSWGLVQASGRGSHESIAMWEIRINADYANYASTYVAVCSGSAHSVTCPITSRQNGRGSATVVAPRLTQYGPQVDPGEYDNGPLWTDVTLYDGNQILQEYDANLDPTLDARGFITLRSWDGDTGVFVTAGRLMGAVNDLQRLPYRRVLNIAKQVYQQVLRSPLVKNFKTWLPGVPSPWVAGNIYEPDALRIQRIANQQINAATTSKGMCSGVVCVLNRTPTLVAPEAYQLNMSCQIYPLIYVDQVQGTIGFVSATLSGLVNQAS